MRRLALSVFPLLAAAVAGCSPTPNVLPAETPPEQGRQALKTALDVWQKGGKPADARPIVVADPDWEEGAKLTSYDVEPTNGRAGVDLLLKVKLSIQKKDGGGQTKTVNFVVGIGAQTVVLRYQ